MSAGHSGPVLQKSLLFAPLRPNTGPDPAERERLLRLSKSLNSGDLVLFAGKGWLSGIIRLFTRSTWTHVAMVVRLPGWDEPLLLESCTRSEVDDRLAGRRVAGVTLAAFHQRVADYAGAVAIRRRRGAPLSPSSEKRLHQFTARLYLRPYKNYLWALFLDLCRGRKRRRNFSGVFCSELVAELYRRLGWLPRTVRASRIVPGHFAPGARLLEGQLEEAQVIKASAAPARDSGAIAPRSAVHGMPPRQRSHAGP